MCSGLNESKTRFDANAETLMTPIPANSADNPLDPDINLRSLYHLMVIGKSPLEIEHNIVYR